MIKILSRIVLFFLVIIYFSGCAKDKNLPLPVTDHSKDIKIGVVSNYGNLFEYFFANFLLRERIYALVDDWELDRFIEKRLSFYLKEKKYKNIKIINPTENIILLKNQRKTIYYKDYLKEVDTIMKENDIDIIIYVENFNLNGRFRISNKNLIIRNVGVTNTGMFNKNFANIVLVIDEYLAKNKDYNVTFTKLNDKPLPKEFFNDKKEIYEKENVEKTKKIIFELLDESIKEYVDSSFK